MYSHFSFKLSSDRNRWSNDSSSQTGPDVRSSLLIRWAVAPFKHCRMSTSGNGQPFLSPKGERSRCTWSGMTTTACRWIRGVAGVARAPSPAKGGYHLPAGSVQEPDRGPPPARPCARRCRKSRTSQRRPSASEVVACDTGTSEALRSLPACPCGCSCGCPCGAGAPARQSQVEDHAKGIARQ